MKIKLIAIGKTDHRNLQTMIDVYCKRIGYYISFSFEIIPDIKNSKNLSEEQQKKMEGNEILKKISPTDHIVLLDEKGKEYSSVDFSRFLQKKMNSGLKNLIFIIGGPYGFSNEVYTRANDKVSLSLMTFSHQMIRLLFTERLYRAFTILRNDHYHHK